MAKPDIDLGAYKLGWSDKVDYAIEPKKGLNLDVVKEISHSKSEPQWMTDFRIKSLERFEKKPMLPWFSENMPDIDFDDIYYYLKPTNKQVSEWDDLPDEMKTTYERLGLPEAEQKYLAGVTAQYESEVVMHKNMAGLEEKGIIFCSMDEALREHEDLVKEHFATVIPPGDNKFAALNSAVWSGGSFIYVPKGVHIDLPLQAYFRINAENMGQFERTLIIADEGSSVHYVEGCTAPTYSSDSLHSAVVEIVVLPGAKVQYTTIQNWSNNVYNLVTKRAKVQRDGTMFWLDCNLGSKVTMKYPAVYLMEPGAKAEILSVAFAGKGQHQDAGAKVIHAAPNTTSTINSKSISKSGGRTSYRGLVKVYPEAKNVKCKVVCDALLLDADSRSDTYPTMDIDDSEVMIEHEATVSKIGEEQLFYLMSRGLSEAEAATMIVNGFIEPIVKHLPMEYAVELNRLVEMEMEGSVG